MLPYSAEHMLIKTSLHVAVESSVSALFGEQAAFGCAIPLIGTPATTCASGCALQHVTALCMQVCAGGGGGERERRG